ncbi:sodium:solute symporter family protein [Thermococci archaeon]|nr:MAG: sodium:solute symporter family protein [Thermococci archaeon]
MMEQWVIGVAILIIWVAVMVVVAWLSTRYRKMSVTDFATTGGTLGVITLFLTYSATYHSSYAFMGTTGATYTHGVPWWNNIHWTVLPGILLWLIGRRLWTLSKKYNYISVGQYVEGVYRSGGNIAKALGIIVSLVGILFVIPYTAMQALGVTYLFQIVSKGHISFTVGLVIFLLLMVFITWIGGMRGVAWTDTVQGIFMFLAMVFGAYWVIKNAFGGLTQVYALGAQRIPEAYSLPGLKEAYTYRFWVSQWVSITVGMIAMPHVFLRYFAGKSLKVIKWAGVFSAAYLTYLYIFVPAIGIGARLLYPNYPTPDRLFPEMLFQYTPFALAAFACAGALAAALSTADSQLHAVSTLFTVDIYKTLVKPDADEKHLYHVDRAFVLIFGAICAWIAFTSPALFLNILQIATAGTAAIAPVLFAPLYWKRVTSKAALTSALAGVIVVALTTFVWKNPLGILSGVWGLIVALLVLVGGSIITKPEESIEDTVTFLKSAF